MTNRLFFLSRRRKGKALHIALTVLGIAVGLHHINLAGRSVFTSSGNEPLTFWIACVCLLMTFPSALTGIFRPKIAGVLLISISLLSFFLSFLGGENPLYCLLGFPGHMLFLGGAFIFISLQMNDQCIIVDEKESLMKFLLCLSGVCLINMSLPLIDLIKFGRLDGLFIVVLGHFLIFGAIGGVFQMLLEIVFRIRKVRRNGYFVLGLLMGMVFLVDMLILQNYFNVPYRELLFLFISLLIFNSLNNFVIKND